MHTDFWEKAEKPKVLAVSFEHSRYVPSQNEKAAGEINFS